jgi:hypothetical protein
MKKIGLAGQILLITVCVSCAVILEAEPAKSAVDRGKPAGYVSDASPKVKLEIDKKRVGAGGVVRVRVNNRSSQEVAYGYEYELARFKNGAWVEVRHGPVFEPRFVLSPDSKGSWQKIDIPRQAASGLYRIRKWVEPGGAPQGKEFPIKATFRVIPR